MGCSLPRLTVQPERHAIIFGPGMMKGSSWIHRKTIDRKDNYNSPALEVQLQYALCNTVFICRPRWCSSSTKETYIDCDSQNDFLQHDPHNTRSTCIVSFLSVLNEPFFLPVVPHKAVAKVSKIGNL